MHPICGKMDTSTLLNVPPEKGHGINTKKMTGLCIEIQSMVSKCSLWPTWAAMVVGKVEREDLTEISVNCRRGRHRSVAAAELLKKCFYPEGRTEHLTIK